MTSRFAALPLPLLLCVCGVFREASGVVLKGNPFDDSLPATHLAVVCTVGSVTALLLFAVMCCMKFSTHGLRLATILVAAVWTLVMLVGMVTWGVTYRTSRDVIQEQASELLAKSANIVHTIKSDLDAGNSLLEAIAAQSREGVFRPNDTVPHTVPHRYLHNMLRTVGKGNPTLHLLFYGTADGLFYAISPADADANETFNLYVNAGGPLRRPPPSWGLCEPYYDLQAGCNASSCGSGSADCPLTCGSPASWEACDPTAGLGPQATAGTDGLRMVQGRFRRNVQRSHLFSKAVDVTKTQSYDPRLRPWYIPQNETVKWTRPYMFAVQRLTGVSSSVGLQAPSGEFVGVVAMDFSLSTFSELFYSATPTPNSLILVVSDKQELLSSSMTIEQVARDTLIPLRETVVDLRNASRHSRLRGAVDTVAARFGGVQAALADAAVFKAGGLVYVSFPVGVAGLPMLAVIEVPYSDLMEKADDASTMAMIAAILICLAASGILFVCIVVALRPLQLLARDMEHIAWMRLDNLSTEPGKRSAVRELAWMQASFEKMVENLTEYRQYLPQSMLHSGASTTASEGGGDMVHAADVASPPDVLAETMLEPVETSIVFTDIKGSTPCWEGCPDGMRKALRLHNTVIRSCIAAHNGYEVKTIGDAFMVAFDSLPSALLFALATQEKLLSAEWPAELLELPQCSRTDNGMWGGLTVRIGVNHGECNIETSPRTAKRDFYGHTVNKAARLESNCIGGAVCVSQTVLGLVELTEIGSPQILPYGKVHLKGIREADSLVFLLPQSLKGRARVLERMMDDRRKKDAKAEEVLLKQQARERQEQKKAAGESMSMSVRTSLSETTTSPGESKGGGMSALVRRMMANRGIGGGGGEMTMTLRDRAEGRSRLERKLYDQALERLSSTMLGHVEMRFQGGLLEDYRDPSSRVNEAVAKVVGCSITTNGCVFAVLGNAVVLGWHSAMGASRGGHTKDSPGAAASCVDASFRFVSALFHDTKRLRPGMMLYTGLCFGTALWGNLGVRGQRFVTAVSPCLTLASFLAQGAIGLQAFCLQTSLLCGGGAPSPYASSVGVRSQTGTLPLRRPVDEWEIVGVQTLLVYEVGEKPADGDEELFGPSCSGLWDTQDDELPPRQVSDLLTTANTTNPLTRTSGGMTISSMPKSVRASAPAAVTGGAPDFPEWMGGATNSGLGTFPLATPGGGVDGGGGAGAEETQDWGWSEEYSRAFFEKNPQEISRGAHEGDWVARRVAEMIVRGEHLRPPMQPILLDQAG